MSNALEFRFALGMKRFPAGRLGDNPSIGISSSLNAAGFKLGRLQTGTPARLDRNTINFSDMPSQLGDASPSPFSFLHDNVDNAVHRPSCVTRQSHNCFQRTIKLLVIKHIQRLKRIGLFATTSI